MNQSFLLTALFSVAAIAGCASSAAPEQSASTTDALRSAGCGPVLYTGEGSDVSQKVANAIAEKDARRICHETPTFCAVDCDAAPIKDSRCTPSAVNSDDGSKPGVTWTCEVTISASSPEPKTVCNVAVRCAPGYTAVDTDGDGCNDSCVKE